MKATTTACIALLLIGLVGGCSPGEGSASGDSDWTVEREAVSFEEDLYVSEAEDFFIGSANDVVVDPEGRIYVADGEEHHVKVLSPEGELEEVIGGHGEGPGEFERPSEVVLARGDSLYVLDSYWGRMSVFTPEHEFAYSFSMRDDGGAPRIPMVLKDGGYFVVQSPPARELVQESGTYRVRAVSADGALGDTLFEAPPYHVVMGERDDRIVTFYSIPFSRGSHFLLGPEEHVHFAYSDSLGVSVYDRHGELQKTISVPFEAVPVTEADLERVLEGRDHRNRSIVEPEIPETKPAFTRFAMDEHGRYWFKRPAADPEVVDWWIVDAEERHVLTGRAPSHIDFSVIRDGYAYGTIRGRDELPAVVRYRVVE